MLLLFCSIAVFAEGPKITVEGSNESLVLGSWLDKDNWTAKDGVEIEKSKLACPSGKDAVVMHIIMGLSNPSAETGYYPRMRFEPSGWEADWSRWDTFEFQLYGKTSTTLPKIDVNVIIKDDTSRYDTKVTLENEKWVKVEIPVKKMKEENLDSTGIETFVIGVKTDNFKNKDMVDIHAGGFKLVRAKYSPPR
jgi:hypothetical protein